MSLTTKAIVFAYLNDMDGQIEDFTAKLSYLAPAIKSHLATSYGIDRADSMPLIDAWIAINATD
jgi:hypothetical protein